MFGLGALAMLVTRTYDAILSDVRMPEVDDPALYLEVERRHPALAGRFVFLTGDTLSAKTSAFLEQIRAPSITKPFDLKELRHLVHRLLTGGAAAAQGPQ